MLHCADFDMKGGVRTFAAVSSNGSSAQLVCFAKFGAAPGTGLWTEAQRMTAPSPSKTS